MAKTGYGRPEGVPPPDEFGFKWVNEPLERVTTAELNLLAREIREPQRYYFVLNTLLTLSAQTHKAILKLVRKEPRFPAQAHMLIRPMIDALFTVAVLVDKPEENSRKYQAAGYRDMWVEYQRVREQDKDYPEWQPVTEMRKRLLDDMAADLGLSRQERSEPNKHIKPWPNPSRVTKKEEKWVGDEARDFLQWVHDTRYAEYSQLSHATMRGGALAVFATMPEEHWDPGKFESDAASVGWLFLLSLVSEVEASCQYGKEHDIKYIWTLLGNYHLEVKEYYDRRYCRLLSGSR